MYLGIHLKYSLFLLHFNETWTFLKDFRQNTQISGLIKIRTVGDELSHVDRQTDMMKTKRAFSNFVKAPKNENFAILPIYRVFQKEIYNFESL
jgi:hypothetical protein